MSVLEKILQEIEDYETKMEDAGISCLCHSWVKEIIKRNLQSGEDNKVLAGDWVPCSVRMPKANQKVDVTFREWMQYSKKYRYGTCKAVYFPKYAVKAEDVWTYYGSDDCIEYDEKTDTVYAEEGWYETIEHWEDYSHCYINCDVIAWRPLPEPYKPDPESADGKRQREREEFFTEYKEQSDQTELNGFLKKRFMEVV